MSVVARHTRSNRKPARVKKKNRKPALTASSADKFKLYLAAVQSPDSEVEFMDRVYRKANGRLPALMREDFCGTAAICAEWVRARDDNKAIGVDLCRETLDWGLVHNIGTLPPDVARRVTLLNRDVRDVTAPKVDVVCALNFSYFLFKDHHTLSGYFAAVRKSLKSDGVFVLDAYGGWESQQVMDEPTKRRGFTYIWEQAHYNPINDDTICHITFKFPDGSVMKRAFTYDWRLWTVAGIRDALSAAGFKAIDVYWEGTGRGGVGNGIYRKQICGDNSAGWNTYIVASH